MKDNAEFQRHADKALSLLFRALSTAGDDFGFKVSLDPTALTIEFDKPKNRIVVRPHPAAHQIWVSTAAGSYKLAWDVVENAFVLETTGQTLKDLLEQTISGQAGEDVSL
jgi:iron donor protein CyaY